MFKVYNKCCHNCLMSKDAIVSPKRRKEIIKNTLKHDSYFICHVATMEGQDVACKGFYDAFKFDSLQMRAATMFGAIEEVPMPEREKLSPYKKLKK